MNFQPIPAQGTGLPSPRRRSNRRYFAQPYATREALIWIYNNLLGPSRRFRELTKPLPADATLHPISPRYTVGFLGDVMPLRRMQLEIDETVKQFFAGCDVLVGNLEGTIVTQRIPRTFLGQAHTPAVLDFLSELFPPSRTVLTCANNHAADYGEQVFAASCALLEHAGFVVIGTAAEPGVFIDNSILLAGFTQWSNRKCDYVRRRPIDLQTIAAPRFSIVLPHWGYEMQAYPNPRQIAFAAVLLNEWDMIVGHHSHWPQPVTTYPSGANRKVVAYSLGNFTFGLPLHRYLRGTIMKAELGPQPDGRWATGRVQWRETRIRRVGRRRGALGVTRP